MSFRSVCFSVIAVSMLVCVTLRAGDDDGKKGKHMKGFVAFVLAHADDLKLTDDQKTKLTALQADDKPPEGGDKDLAKEHNKEIHAKVAELLTKDQRDKIRRNDEQEGRRQGNDPAASTPASDGEDQMRFDDAAKTDAAKTDAAKTDTAKTDAAKPDDGNNMGGN